MKVKLKFEDTFSFCILIREIETTPEKFSRMKNDLGKIVKREFKDNINWIWRLKSVKEIEEFTL